jgi:transcriptional enhancer factor
MHLQHQQSCVPAADSPFLEGTPVDASSSQHRGMLQERSANQAYEYHSDTTPSQLKQSYSPIPTENTYAQRSVAAGTYYTGNVHAQHIGLAPFGIERPEKQIRLELERLYKMLQRSDKYQKYREKQPVMTPAEVIARDAVERKEKARRVAEGIPQDKKDNTVWPEFLEYAFWKGMLARYYITAKNLICLSHHRVPCNIHHSLTLRELHFPECTD